MIRNYFELLGMAAYNGSAVLTHRLLRGFVAAIVVSMLAIPVTLFYAFCGSDS